MLRVNDGEVKQAEFINGVETREFVGDERVEGQRDDEIKEEERSEKSEPVPCEPDSTSEKGASDDERKEGDGSGSKRKTLRRAIRRMFTKRETKEHVAKIKQSNDPEGCEKSGGVQTEVAGRCKSCGAFQLFNVYK